MLELITYQEFNGLDELNGRAFYQVDAQEFTQKIFDRTKDDFESCDDCIVFNKDFSRAWTILFDDAMDDFGEYEPIDFVELTATKPSYYAADQWAKMFDSVAITLITLYGMPVEFANECADDHLIDVTSDALVTAYFNGWHEYASARDIADGRYDNAERTIEFNDGSAFISW